jgi:hypothetical protein
MWQQARQLGGKGRVLALIHPPWPCFGLAPAHKVIARAKAFAAANVGSPRSMLLEQHIDTEGLQPGNEEVVAVEGIGQHHVSGAEEPLKLAKQTQLATSLSRVRPMATSSTAPVDKQITPVRRIRGKPTPLPWLQGWG